MRADSAAVAGGGAGLGTGSGRSAGRSAGRSPVVGMVGAGQLARMTAQAAIGLGIEFRVLADTDADSAAQVCARTQVGDYRSAGDLLAFGAGCDVVTFDHEHVPGEHLSALADITAVRPGAAALAFAQDKGAMRDRLCGGLRGVVPPSEHCVLGELGVRCPRYQLVTSLAEVVAFAAASSAEGAGGGWPVVLKATCGGYDGKGVWVCADQDAAAEVISHGIGLLAEEHVAFDSELAVLVARSPAGQGAAYPVVRTVQRDGVCREVIAPAPGLGAELAIRAQRLGLALAAELGVTGLLAVELFQVGGELMVNELAMRPHNCGHWTIDAARTSQFEQHLRAVLDLPLGSPELTAPVAVMVNVLGEDSAGSDLHGRLAHVLAADPGIKVHLYGKTVRPGRKVGHVTATGSDLRMVRDRAWRAAGYLSLGSEDAGLAQAAEGSGRSGARGCPPASRVPSRASTDGRSP